MSTSHELLEKAAKNPGSLNGVERYKVGLAILTTLLDPQIEPEPLFKTEVQRTETLHALELTLISGLQAIRNDKDISDHRKLLSGKQVLSGIDFTKFPDKEIRNRLFGEAWLNIAEGIKPLLIKRHDELNKQWREGMLRLPALIRLGDRVSTLSPVEQIEFLSTDLATVEALDVDSRKQILLAWAREKIEKGASESDVLAMTNFFFEQQDYPSGDQVTLAYIMKESRSQGLQINFS